MFDFRPTRPYSSSFNFFGNEDCNFYMNSGSAMICLLIIFVWAFCFSLLYMCTRCCVRNAICRKLSRYSHKNATLLYPVMKFFFEGYLELIIPSLVSLAAIIALLDAPDIWTWFETSSDLLNSVTTIVCFIICMIIPFMLRWLFSHSTSEL